MDHINIILNIASLIVLFVAIFLIRKSSSKDVKGRTDSEVAYKMQVMHEASMRTINSIIVTDNDCKIVFWNPAAEKLLGWSEEEVKGRTTAFLGIDIVELLHKRQPTDTQMYSVSETNGLEKAKIQVNVSVSDFKINGVLHYMIIFKSIADRVRLEQDHKKELDLYHDGEQVGKFGFWSWDLGTQKVCTSKGFRELFDLDPDDKSVDVQYLLKRIYHEDKKKVQDVLTKAIDDRKDYYVEYSINHLDGSQQKVHSRGRVFSRENGTIEKIAGVLYQSE